jgi:hypothetical protein
MKEMKVKAYGQQTSYIQNRTTKPLAIALSGTKRWLSRGGGEGNLTNIQCKPIQNCHNEAPLIKMKEKISIAIFF